MTCREALDTIVLSLYGEAPERDRSALSAHLARCSHCSQEARDLSSAAAAIALAEGGDAVRAVPIPVSPSVAAPSRRRVWLTAAAAVLLLFVGGLVVRDAALRRGETRPVLVSSDRAQSTRNRDGRPTTLGSSATAGRAGSIKTHDSSSDASLEAEISSLSDAISSLESSAAEL